jgi:hypothetical protein
VKDEIVIEVQLTHDQRTIDHIMPDDRRERS